MIYNHKEQNEEAYAAGQIPYADTQRDMDNRYRNYGNGQAPTDDYYAEQYRRQLDEYSRIDNTDYTGGADFEFEQYPQQDSRYVRQNQPQPDRQYVHSNRTQGSGATARNARAARRQNAESRNPVRETNNYKPSKARKSAGAAKGGTGSVEKKKGRLKKVLICVLSVLTALFVIINVVLFCLVSKVKRVETGKRDDTIEAFMKSDDVKNILIIGSDTRDLDQAGRTDSMIVLSINSKKKEITMISLMRDMYLPIVGYANDGTKMYSDDQPDGLYRNKLNSAYVFGGAELLMDTIKYNFGLEIDDYFYIDFSTFVNIIDAIGGIELDVTDEEVEVMNISIRGQNKVLGKENMEDHIEKGGHLLLNGNQALSYARLRYVGNADFQRTQRQRTVINKIIEKVKQVGPINKYSFLRTFLSNLTTNMSKSDLFFYGYKVPFLMGYTLKELRIPSDNDFEYGTHEGQSTLDVDIEKCRKAIKEAVFS